MPTKAFVWRMRRAQAAALVACLSPALYVSETWSSWAAAAAIALNTIVRVAYPSQYCPASQAGTSLLYSPVLARTLATVAEFVFYEAEARVLGLVFWGGPLGIMTMAGEALCWGHVLLQSEILGFVEDCTWTLLQLVAVLTSASPLRFVVAAPFCVYMLFRHLPRMAKRLAPSRSGSSGWYHWGVRAPLRVPDSDTLAWTVPSLLAKPVTYALLRAADDDNAAGSQALWTRTLPILVLILSGCLALALGKVSNGQE